VQSIFEAMPETKAATDVLNALSEQLHNEYAMMQQEFNGKYAAYQALAPDFVIASPKIHQ
jgi:hypothetical protein